MIKKKIFLILILLSLISILSITTSFAANSKAETFIKQKQNYINRYELNVSRIDITLDDFEKIRITIKDDKKNYYKIKNVVYEYTFLEDNVTKIYNGYGKQSLTFQTWEFDYLNKLTINYYTSNSIKNESIYSFSDLTHLRKRNGTFNGKTAIVKNLEKGYCELGTNYVTTYNKFQIKTKNKKYKIKKILVKYGLDNDIYFNSSKTYSKSFKGNGKTKLTITTPKKYKKLYIKGLRIYYY